MEAMRVGMGLGFSRGEGGDYGCWFWPMRGSGIFVNVGRSLCAGSKANAATMLQVEPHDHTFAAALWKQNYSSLQILKGATDYGGRRRGFHVKTSPTFEIIHVGPGCFTPGPNVSNTSRMKVIRPIVGPCVSAAVPLRTGWNATQSCSCDEIATPLLNCLGTT